MTQLATTTIHARQPAHPSRWPRRLPYLAAAWSLAYGAVALAWTMSGRGFPLGENDPEAAMSLLQGLPADTGAPLFAAVALAGAGVGLLMARVRHVPATGRYAALGFGAATAFAWLLLVPDTRVLALVGYLPMAIAVAPFDAELRDSFADAIDGVILNHAAVLVGGFLWAATTVVFARRTAGACEHCGRGAGTPGWMTRTSARRWGRSAVGVAVAVPALYALTRWVWVAGIPMGIDESLHEDGMASGDLWAGAWLGTFGLVGGVLTLGLVQRWGEVFPAWMLGLRGRRVPVKLAVVPAAFVAVIVTSGGIGLVKAGLSDGAIRLNWTEWAAIGPALLWPLWGVALAVATYAYYVRRRGQCTACGKDDEPLSPPQAVTTGERP
ncbi:hypothetical protein G1H11_09265 [Phytoactinopolyspora alkaliphila]|uniref:Uncharacterized protein n=1 Tax=Phytoactinopolyspora alkaliphila TaxID=1783498 RepID=A0A6N9YKL8_9ACTN|nr:hypothetical protein [Phytoactinopolyspora alkaliphila]NED95502.1 hypothetical protein [Phytoactinopolyspora alkaliphila]